MRYVWSKRIGGGQRPGRPYVLLALVIASFGFGLAFATVQQTFAKGPNSGGSYALATDEEEAAKVLGRPVPQPLEKPAGLTRTQFSLENIQSDTTLATPRKVRQTFAVGGQDLALLTVFRGTLGQSLDPVTTVQLGGTAVTVFTKTLNDGTTVVSYRWQLGDLAAFLDINLVHGITREMADRVVASIR